MKIVLQELVKTGQYENIRIASGLQIPLNENEPALAAMSVASLAVSQQLKMRLAQVKKASWVTDPKLAKLARPGSKVFAAVSRLVPTQEFENVRCDVEISFYVDDTETIWAAFERAYTDLAAQLKAAIHTHLGTPETGALKSGDTKPSSFDWS